MPNPERIDLVRLRLGLTKMAFAERLGVDRKTVQRMEQGGEISEQLMDRLCAISGYSRSFFRKPGVDYPSPDGVSFRSLRSLTAGPRDAALAAGALAFEIDDWIRHRFELPEHSIPQLNNQTPVAAAAAVRAAWGIGEKPIANMVNLLEAHGVRVFSLVEETRHLDAYSFWRNEKPYVFLNTLKTAEHSRFDAAHELGHLVMHRHTGSNHKTAEDEANAFASALLIPPNDLIAKLPRAQSLRQIIQWKKRWGVSAAALNYALRKNELISEWHYRGNYIQLNKLGRENEPDAMERETSQVWRKILTALWSEGISTSHIARELAIPEREISNLLFGIAATIATPNTSGGTQTLYLVKG
ncbi:XRE family transcriptional regulator [Rhizobium beringeri]|jgi:Zn-dependent peptidase ImmA (M78 family)/DNA-binding XRE family transcriptional regulator|uniref:XRE family transcriptional regulator n=1 Tax=Rhizobium beringeri TaxID=3019934 RepID=UPI002E144FA8|nr:XRE family transcriptional regulator [Rhizobium beringeri]WSH84695.1 XRE family transcriptional regulator [Rhizobium beringeri]